MTDDFSKYDNYRGPTPPPIEQAKYNMSRESQNAQRAGQYGKAAQIKRNLARICTSQGKHADAHLLNTTARELERRRRRR